MDEYDALLLSAVHKGDVVSIQTYLSSMSDPNVYLNRVYDEPNEQKCTLLMIACLNGYDDIVYMLLKCFKPDLEVLNIIRINNKDKKSEIYQDVTILWAAAAINHFLIVKRLVEQGARVNHATSTNSTPVRCACYSGNIEMTRYLVENGADIHITKNNNETNLSLSVYCKHLQLSTYLVDELDCDVNECDDDGRSALYFAVKCGSIEIVQFLLNRGARNFPPHCDRMSPLMLAADKRRSDLVDAISLYCSLLEWVEGEELLGSAFACAEHGHCDLQQSFEHYYRALQLRSIHNLPKVLKESAIEIFNNRQECQTIDQLEVLRLNPDNMHIEALLVRERLLGPVSEEYRYSVIYRGAILADAGQYHQAVALWMYELKLARQYLISIDPEDMRQFVALFSDMIFKSSPIPIEALLTIVATTVGEVKNDTEKIDYNLHTLLFLTTIVSQVRCYLRNHFSSISFLFSLR
jgi:ankyrin repeat protein